MHLVAHPVGSSEELVKEVCIRCMGRFRIARLDPDPGYRIAKSAEELSHGYMWAVSTILAKNELPADTQAPAWREGQSRYQLRRSW
jgi:hypothetical protein